MRTLRTSVRRLVEFLLRSGDIDSNGDWRSGIEAMQSGSNIHRTLQAAGGDAYQAEVPLACSIFFPGNAFDPYAARLDIHEESVSDQEGFFLRVEGRADGIIDDGVHPLIVDEIKGVTRDVSDIENPINTHMAQALCYAYLYLRSKRGSAALSSAFSEQVDIRITYASMTTGEVRQIERMRNVPDIEVWFFSLLDAAQRWASWRIRHDELRESSLTALEFPLNPRVGQQSIMDAITDAIHANKRLYVQAPTGSGKTIATMYPALKAMGAGKISHIVFLTAKTVTRGPVLECLNLLRQQHFAANVLVVTARNKICPLRNKTHGTEMRSRPLASLCNPVECPLARGHYDQVNDALYEAIVTYDVLDSGCIEEVAARHHVCPYELQRDMAQWSDIIICDYHYAFAPSAGLIGLADEPDSSVVYLVDEAHNLPERMRSMYSAELTMAELKELERVLRTRKDLSELLQTVHAVIATFPRWNKVLTAKTQHETRRDGNRPHHEAVHVSDAFVDALTALATGFDAALEYISPTQGGTSADGHGTDSPSEAIELFLALRDTSLRTRAFLGAFQRAETGYVTFLGRTENGSRKLKVYCVDPSHDLTERLKQAKAAVFFSGTLLPMDYHRKLLAAQDDDTSLYAQSSFDSRHRQILIGSDVNARYSRRGPKLYARIAKYLITLTHARPGNYLVFLPSYAMTEEVAKTLSPLTDSSIDVLRQRPAMREDERERFVAKFRQPHNSGASIIGLCVLGGIFGESIDLPGAALIGVVVVGTGMPPASDGREVIKNYFDAKKDKGFAYAYTYPGMIKVLQAVGRLIRTEEDRGVVLLLDERFLEDELQQAFPEEWRGVQTCTIKTLPNLLAQSFGIRATPTRPA